MRRLFHRVGLPGWQCQSGGPVRGRCFSQHYEVRRACDPDRRKSNRLIESHEASAVVRRQAQEIDICDLPSAMDARVVEDRLVEDRNLATPVFVVRGGRRTGEKSHGSPWRHRAWIAWLTQNADTAVQRGGARGPSVLDLSFEPPPALLMAGVITVKKSQEETDV